MKPSDNMKNLFATADQTAEFLPVAMVGARFHLADRRLLLRIGYNWTPELMLAASGTRKFWVFEDWTAQVVAQDPRKAAVMKTIAAWGDEWHARVLNAFHDGRRERK